MTSTDATADVLDLSRDGRALPTTLHVPAGTLLESEDIW